MALIIHITIALTSIGYTTYAYLRPATSKLSITYTLVAGTLVSGTYLVISTHSSILKSCTAGLVYLAGMLAGIIAIRRKLAKQEI